MKTSLRFASHLVLLVLLSTSSSARAQNDGSAAKSGPIVVLMTIDGFPARALKDPRLPMPTLRKLIANGAHADAMIPINPTVTWPNHTALITGVDASEHHVMANGRIEFPAPGGPAVVKPWVPKSELVNARTLYEEATEKGMTTGQVDWVAIYGAKDVQWQFGEKPEWTSPIVQDLVHQGVLTQDRSNDSITAAQRGATRFGQMPPSTSSSTTRPTCCCFICCKPTRFSTSMLR